MVIAYRYWVVTDALDDIRPAINQKLIVSVFKFLNPHLGAGPGGHARQQNKQTKNRAQKTEEPRFLPVIRALYFVNFDRVVIRT